MATLLSKVRGITKSTTTETSDVAVVNFLQAGANFVVFSTPKNMLWFLASGSNVADGNGYNVSGTDIVLEVSRDDIVCDEIPVLLAHQSDYAGSLYQATAFFPKYYIRNQRIFIKPDPNASQTGMVYTASPPTITSSTDSDSISYTSIENIIIDYASALDFTALGNYFSRKASDNADSGDADDALSKAQRLIDDAANVGGDTLSGSTQDWITAEDSEIAVVTIQAAQQEVQRALAEINRGSSFSKESANYFAKANEYFKLASQELSNWINSNPAIMRMQAEAQSKGASK